MATREELMDALQNADAAAQKGDKQAAADARALADQIDALGPSGAAPKSAGAPTAFQSVQASIPGRVVQGARDPIDSLAALLPEALAKGSEVFLPATQTDPAHPEKTTSPIHDWLMAQAKSVQDLNARNEQGYQQSRANTGQTGFDVSRLVGNIASPANLAGGRILSTVPRAATLAGRIGQGIVGNSALGAATAPSGERGTGALFGGLVGGAAPVASKVVGSILNPTVTADVKALLDKGIRLTPGQILGGGWKGAEDKITSLPYGLGGFVSKAQRTATEDFNRHIMDSALAPIGVTLPKTVSTGRHAVDYVATKIGDAYDNILPQMTGKMDPTFVNDLKNIVQKASGRGAAQSTLDRLENVTKAQLFDKVQPNGTYDGNKLKEIQSEIGRLASNFGSSASQDDRALGGMLDDVHGAFRNMLARNNPQHIGDLNNADAAYAQYARIRRASSALGARDGVFSGPQFANAVKASDKSVGKGAYARGNAFMQDISDPASNVLPSAVPDSGTAGRIMMGAVLGGSHVVAPQAVPVLAALTALYTKGGTAAARGLLTSRPAAVRALGSAATNANTPLMSIPLVSLLSQMGGVQQGN